MPDQDFKRSGNDVFTSIEITFAEAILGCQKQIRTLTRTVSLTIPAGTQPGAKMRLKGMGLSISDGKGDQYVEIIVTIPEQISDEQRKLLEEWGS